LMKTVRRQREAGAGERRGEVRSCQGPRETERAVTRERDAEDRRDVVNGEGRKTGGEERKERERDAVLVLAEREREVVGKEDVAVEVVEWMVKSLWEVPPEYQRDAICVAEVCHLGDVR